MFIISKNTNYYFISNKVNHENIEFWDKTKNNLDDIVLGKFLRYGCVHNLNKDKPCQRGYLLTIMVIVHIKFIYILFVV
jgi:hypothetical protein